MADGQTTLADLPSASSLPSTSYQPIFDQPKVQTTGAIPDQSVSQATGSNVPVMQGAGNTDLEGRPLSFGLPVATPDFVQQVGKYLEAGGDINKISTGDQLAVALAKDPDFFKKNPEAFYQHVYKPLQAQNPGDQFNQAVGAIPGMIWNTGKSLFDAVMMTGKNQQDSAELFYRKATGMTHDQQYQDLLNRVATENATGIQGITGALTTNDDLVRNVNSTLIQSTKPIAKLFAKDPASQEQIERTYSQLLLNKVIKDQQNQDIGNGLQMGAAKAYQLVGATADLGKKMETAKPDPSATSGYETILNPLNYTGLIEGAATVGAVRPLMFEQGLRAAEDVAGATAKKTALDVTQILPANPELNAADPAYIATRNLQSQLAPEARNATQDAVQAQQVLNSRLTTLGKISGDPGTATSAVSNLLQAGGSALQNAGELAGKVTNMPERIGHWISGGNQDVGDAIADVIRKYAFGAALHHLGPVGGAIEAGLEHLPDIADSTAGLLKTMGQEYMYADNTIPYWTRVAMQNKGMPKGIASFLDSPLVETATGMAKAGATTAATGAAIGGLAGGIPGAVAGAVQGGILGMAGGGFGQWQKFQNPNEYLLAARSDWKRYSDLLSPTERQQFSQLSPTNQLMIAQSASHFPGLRIDYFNDPNGARGMHYVDPGGASHIQVNLANPDSAIAGIAAHEMIHAATHSGMVTELYDTHFGNPITGEIGQFTALGPDGKPMGTAGNLFTPSKDWQQVPDWAAVPPGGVYRVNMTTNKSEARWDNPPTPETVIDKRTGKPQTPQRPVDPVDPATGRYYANQQFQNLKNQYLNALAQSGVPTSHLNDFAISREIYAEHGVDHLMSGGAVLDANSAFRPGLYSASALKTALAKMGYTFGQDGRMVGFPGEGPYPPPLPVSGTGLFTGLERNPTLTQFAQTYFKKDWEKGLVAQEEQPTRSFTKKDLQNPNTTETWLNNASEILRNPDGTAKRDPLTGQPLMRSPKEVKEYNANFAESLRKGLDSLPEDQRFDAGLRKTTDEKGQSNYFTRYLPDNVLDSLAATNQYNAHQIASLRMLSRVLADKGNPGAEMRFFYRTATTPSKRYGTFAGSERLAVPYGFEITHDNNVNIKSVDFNQLNNNYLRVRNRDPYKTLWNDAGEFTQDAHTYFSNHKDGRPGADAIGQQKRNAINALAGFGTQEQANANPLVDRMPNSVRPIIKSFAIDRANQISATGAIRPFISENQYRLMNRNYLPRR